VPQTKGRRGKIYREARKSAKEDAEGNSILCHDSTELVEVESWLKVFAKELCQCSEFHFVEAFAAGDHWVHVFVGLT